MKSLKEIITKEEFERFGEVSNVKENFAGSESVIIYIDLGKITHLTDKGYDVMVLTYAEIEVKKVNSFFGHYELKSKLPYVGSAIVRRTANQLINKHEDDRLRHIRKKIYTKPIREITYKETITGEKDTRGLVILLREHEKGMVYDSIYASCREEEKIKDAINKTIRLHKELYGLLKDPKVENLIKKEKEIKERNNEEYILFPKKSKKKIDSLIKTLEQYLT
ncbi:hypothetical protein AYK26_04905 [Euryarchaeota archaeon SM23-78]|nr:MAG: hypothetical protein AYK26_04905 [Euryarchaeota archaeon SM23-78]